MHVLILPSWYPLTSIDVRGVFFRDQALALKKSGHNVGVIAPLIRPVRTAFKKRGRPVPSYYTMDEGVPTYRKPFLAALPRIPYGNYLLFKRVARKLLLEYVANYGKPDIIHGHAAILGGAVAADLGREFGIPVVLTEHSSGFAKEYYADWQLELAEKAFRRSRACIAVSPALAAHLEKQLPSTVGRWTWIPNVVADRFAMPKSAPLTERTPVFLNLALMNVNKGQIDLVRAFHRLILSGFSAELWLAGDGPIKGALTEEASRLGILEKIRFLGLIAPAAVPRLLEQVDVMVISSHYETFGLVAAEALMAGLPVVATRCGGPECIVSEENGLLVPPKDPEALCEAMRDVGKKLLFYNRQEIARRANSKFSGQAVATQLTSVYQRVLSDAASVEYVQ